MEFFAGKNVELNFMFHNIFIIWRKSFSVQFEELKINVKNYLHRVKSNCLQNDKKSDDVDIERHNT